jgi:hypothetical protein
LRVVHDNIGRIASPARAAAHQAIGGTADTAALPPKVLRAHHVMAINGRRDFIVTSQIIKQIVQIGGRQRRRRRVRVARVESCKVSTRRRGEKVVERLNDRTREINLRFELALRGSLLTVQ